MPHDAAPQAQTPDPRALMAALVVVQMAFGGLPVAGKFVLPHVPPFALALLRLVAGTLALFALERAFVRSRLPPRRDLLAFAGLALLGVVLNQGLFLVGLQYTTATNAVLLIATIPAFTALVAVLLRHERTTPRKMLGLGVSFAGVAVLVAGSGIDLGPRHLWGNLLIVLNSLSYSLFLVLSRPILARHDPLTVISWVFLFGALEMAVIAAPDVAAVDLAGFEASTWAGLAYVLLAATILSYGLNNWALRFAAASRVANFVYLQPLVGTVLAWLVLDEAIGLRTLASGALILGGIALTNVRSPFGRARSPSE